jgi:hypothetical protein
MNVGIWTEAAQFPEKEYINKIFVAEPMKITTHSSPYAVYIYNVHNFGPFICGVNLYELFSFVSIITTIKTMRDSANF